MKRRTVIGGATAVVAAAGAATVAQALPSTTAGPNTSTSTAEPDFGAHVHVFDPSMSSAQIQSTLDSVFKAQETNQFGDERVALLFKPGSYDVTAKIGFFTQIAGLGLVPGKVTINGSVQADADWFDGNATQNFWRCAENLTVNPTGGVDMWAVSQAAPYRRIHLKGTLALDDGGWSSGGFLADSKIDGAVNPGGQQQWFTRNSTLNSWSGNGNWNAVFVGTKNHPKGNWPDVAFTRIGKTPVIREKPFLYVDDAGAYQVFVPALRTAVNGTSWESGSPAGESLPISDFFVAQPTNTAAELNAALQAGKHLLLTPGVYQLDRTLSVNRSGTVILGLGLATLTPLNGVIALETADVPGVKIAGILIDAGTTSSYALARIGPKGASADHTADPTSLHDVFLRVGGHSKARAERGLIINNHGTIGDHLWIWRADHDDSGGSKTGWSVNPAKVGLIVSGDDVTMYGLFVEHFQGYQTRWDGDRGRTYFYQNEMPYDPPNQDAWMNGTTRGYAAYKVADDVTSHQAYGLGSYCYFNVNNSVVADHAFEVPKASGIVMHNLVTVSLGGNQGTIAHVINDQGGSAGGSGAMSARVTAYP
ncbi:adenylyl cyclase [Kineosporia sp. J2-2]|uniref:Adenylyl cyclase n=1 Tax=Kineosporia corallincola TaxID=2835133 RepID=A0ABS5TCG5_9ACTN|nr:adenylyl cyclase [Kineosporia corallincola]MBT0768767.1 adenylyl cyclase [Kineosporia corallincola]